MLHWAPESARPRPVESDRRNGGAQHAPTTLALLAFARHVRYILLSTSALLLVMGLPLLLIGMLAGAAETLVTRGQV